MHLAVWSMKARAKTSLVDRPSNFWAKPQAPWVRRNRRLAAFGVFQLMPMANDMFLREVSSPKELTGASRSSRSTNGRSSRRVQVSGDVQGKSCMFATTIGSSSAEDTDARNLYHKG